MRLQGVDVTLSVINNVLKDIQTFLNQNGADLDGAQAPLDGVQVIDGNKDILEEFSKYISVGWSVGRLVGWLVGRLVGWSVGRLVGF